VVGSWRGWGGLGWLTGWQYRKSHEIIGSTAGAQTDYQIRIKVNFGSGTDSGENVYLNGKCKADFGDIRFTADDGETLLSYWMEEKVDGNYAIFWVKVPSIPASPNTVIIYIYYGNAGAMTTSDGNATFLFFDEFNTLDTNKWDTYGSVSVSNSLLVLTGNGSYRAKVMSKTFQSTENSKMRLKAKAGSTTESAVLAVLQHDKQWGSTYNRPSNGFWHETFGIDFNIYKAVNTTVTKLTNISYNFFPDTNFHTLMFAKSGSYLKGWADDVLKTSVTDTTTFTQKYIAIASREIAHTTYVDWVFVAKYVEPEPSHGAWGSEEAVIIGTIHVVSQDYPLILVKKGSAQELRSKFSTT